MSKKPKIKPVKAWAVVEKGEEKIDFCEIYKTKNEAKQWSFQWEKIIPVLITPLAK